MQIIIINQILNAMKKTLLSLMAIVALSIATLAQTWTTVNSNLDVARGVGQISIGMNNPNAMWAFAVDGTGLIVDSYTKSIDGGATWTKGSFNAGTGLSQLFAIDENVCWALFNTGANQGIYKTTDGGTTWTKKGTAYGSSSFADAMHFFNATDGFAIGDPNGGYYEVYTTSDGGETWTRVAQTNLPNPSDASEYGITGDYCAVGNDVWFGTNEGRVFHSTDKGHTWTASLTSFGNAEVVQPLFADAMNGFAFRSYLDLGLITDLALTSDGGATWTDVLVGGACYGRYFYLVPGTVNTYVASAGLASPDQGISYSYDGGNNWSPITAGGDFQANAWLDVVTGWAGSTTAAKKSTGGMQIYTGDSLLPLAANFEADYTGISLGQSVIFTNLSHGFPTTSTWTFQGGTPPTYAGNTPPAITYSTPGSFDVTLKVFNAYTSNTVTKTGYIYVGGVGISELGANAVSVFPNPVKDIMTVQADKNIKEIYVYNVTGQLLINSTVNAKTITVNTSGLTTGIYTLKAILDNGTINKKIVIQ